MVAVRFAPSPTGYLHVGGARTAIFNWLFARKEGGKFFLRIEDTDQQRSGEDMVEAILDSLTWLGLDWDAPPVRQSQRSRFHQECAERLLASGHAYRSFATAEQMAAARQQAQLDGREFRARDEFPRLASEAETELLQAAQPFAVRFAVLPGETSFVDSVFGEIAVNHATIDDFVILRSDGQPTYNLAVVVDDHDMGITHVIRGADHISNTPKQIMLYRALEMAVPDFAHVPLILGPDKTRLSKRHGATAVGEYRSRGVLPEALFNYLALLGWKPADDTLEILSRPELIELFSLAGVASSNAVFDDKKLEWMNGEYLSRSEVKRLEPLAKAAFREAGVNADNRFIDDSDYFFRVLSLLQTRVRTIPEFVTFGSYFFVEPAEFDEAARRKHWNRPETAGRLRRLAEALATLDNFSEAAVESCLRELAATLQISAGQLIHPARLAVTGFGVSPGIFETMALIGKERVLARLQRAADLTAAK